MSARHPPTVVAVPARDEVDRIRVCLNALHEQRDLSGARLPSNAIRVVVLANNCHDETADSARAAGACKVVELNLPPSASNAGGARRAAMEAAACLLPGGPSGLICTTDADSRPRPDWIARLWKAMDGGAQAIAGAVDFDPHETEPLGFSDHRQLEGRYAALQAEIIARTDPEAHNPWPNHIWAWGANLAATADAYRRVGGLPPHPLAEDRAFVEQLRRHDVPVRHCLDARVWTSARRVGRAEGGLASLVDDHAGEDRAPCDAALEPARLAYLRAAWRRRFRRAYLAPPPEAMIGRRLEVSRNVVVAALAQPTFGAAWSMIQAASPRLQPHLLGLGDLPLEIRRAERLVRRLSPEGPDDRSDRDHAASAGLWSAKAAPR